MLLFLIVYSIVDNSFCQAGKTGLPEMRIEHFVTPDHLVSDVPGFAEHQIHESLYSHFYYWTKYIYMYYLIAFCKKIL